MKTLTRPPYITPEEWEVEYEVETLNAAPVHPRRTINPGIFIAIVDGFILGVWLVFNPDLAIYAGYALTLVPLACIAVVMSGKARRLLR